MLRLKRSAVKRISRTFPESTVVSANAPVQVLSVSPKLAVNWASSMSLVNLGADGFSRQDGSGSHPGNRGVFTRLPLSRSSLIAGAFGCYWILRQYRERIIMVGDRSDASSLVTALTARLACMCSPRRDRIVDGGPCHFFANRKQFAGRSVRPCP